MHKKMGLEAFGLRPMLGKQHPAYGGMYVFL